MRWLHRLSVAWREWFVPSSLDRETAEELQFHFDRQVEVNVAAGMCLDEARRAAAIAIGNAASIVQSSREGRAGAAIRQFARDVGYGARLLGSSPGFAISAIAIVAIGIASVTTIFTVVYGVVLKPLPFRDPERLVNIWTVARTGESRHALVNGADYRDWLAQNHSFDDIAVLRNLASYNLIGGSGEPERLLAARISANLLPMLGVSPALGRNFTEQEDEVGGDDKVLLSDALWRRRFAADPGIVGQTINLSGVPHTVVGVMSPEFQYPGREFQIWTPLTINPAELARTVSGSNLIAIGRLKPGVSVEQAQADMGTIADRLASLHKTHEDRGFKVVPTHADMLANVRASLYVMLGATLCLLLLAALNLSTLLSARAAARQREVAVRLALGATRGRVAVQTIAEVVPVLALGGAAGVALAAWAVASFIPLAPASLPRVENIAVNGGVLAAAMAVLAVTGVIAALLPAAQAWRADLTPASRGATRGATAGAAQARARNVLVVTQIALAFPLITGGLLLTRTFTALTSADPGFDANGVLSVHLAIPRSKYRNDAAVAGVTAQIAARAAEVPGVRAAGLVNRLPLAGGAQAMTLEFDVPNAPQEAMPTVDTRTATPGYFAAMRIPLIGGRLFDSRDTATAPPVAVIDHRVAQRLWPGGSAVGKRVRIPPVLTNNTPQPWIEIVGVVGHVIHDSIELDSRAQVYWPNAQWPQDRVVLVARADGDAAALTPMIRQAIRDIDPEQPVYDVRTMDEVVARSLGQRWLNMALIVTFASAALLLCAIGVYGVIAFGVSRRQREFGIRLALGAARSTITNAVVGRGVVLAAAGTAMGVAMAVALARGMESMLFGVTPLDLPSFATAVLVMLGVALAASYLPARRAAAVDPATTLRAE